LVVIAVLEKTYFCLQASDLQNMRRVREKGMKILPLLLLLAAAVVVIASTQETLGTTIYSNATELDLGFQGAQIPTGELIPEVYDETNRLLLKLGDIVNACNNLEGREYGFQYTCGTVLHNLNEGIKEFFLNNTKDIETILYS
jgi:hypothetical protein